MCGSDDSILVHYDSTNGDFIFFKSSTRFIKGKSHPARMHLQQVAVAGRDSRVIRSINHFATFLPEKERASLHNIIQNRKEIKSLLPASHLKPANRSFQVGFFP